MKNTIKGIALILLLISCTTTIKPPTSTPIDTSDFEFENMIANSSCAKKQWTGRGQMPAGTTKGLTLSFARSLCRQRAGQSVGALLSKPNTGGDSKDVVSWYNSNFTAKGMTNETPEKVLRHLYTLGFGLSMRESSGSICEGRDTTASNTSSDTAEAGLFQTSWNSNTASSELRGLFAEYSAHPDKCLLSVFKESDNCAATSNFGSGDGLAFQKLAKSCPAFAAEYAMVTLRVLRKHYGPINRKEAELSSECNDMLYEVEKVLTPEACEKLL